MKKRIVIIGMFILFINDSYSQTWNSDMRKDNFSSISISMDPNSNLKSSTKNIATEFERTFTKFYVRAEFRYVDSPKSSYIDNSIAAGLHFSFFKKENDAFYVGVREGGIFRENKVFNTIGGELGINLRLNSKIVIGVRTTLDYRTDQKIWHLPSKFVNSNYIKIGWVLP